MINSLLNVLAYESLEVRLTHAFVYLVKAEFIEYSFDSYLAASYNASNLLYHVGYYNYSS